MPKCLLKYPEELPEGSDYLERMLRGLRRLLVAGVGELLDELGRHSVTAGAGVSEPRPGDYDREDRSSAGRALRAGHGRETA